MEDKIIYNPPEDYKKNIDQSFIELAQKLFTASTIGENGTLDRKPIPIRFIRGTASDSIIIILNEQSSLWFTKKNGEWIYDGWEFGDYSKSWRDKERGNIE